MAKIKLEDIRQELAQDNWEVVSTEYTNLDTEMEFKCNEGHAVFGSWKKIRAKRICPQCQRNQAKFVSGSSVPKPQGAIRVLGLDQATHTTGYAIFENRKLIYKGAFTAPEITDEIARDHVIKEWLISLIQNWKIDYIGFEGIQLQDESGKKLMGVTVFETLARLQGILMETAYEYQVPYKICPTNTWRHHCGVKGRTRADRKRSMQLLVKEWYDMTISDDESDAIGIGKYVSDTFAKPKIMDWT